MYYKSFKINNFKSHYDSGRADLRLGFNVVTGQNNVGKTAFLEAAALRFERKPHRSLKIIPKSTDRPNPSSVVEGEIVIFKDEFKSLFYPGLSFLISLPVPGSDFAQDLGYMDNSRENVNKLLEYIFSRDELTFHFILRKDDQGQNLILPRIPSYGIYSAQGADQSHIMASCTVRDDGTISVGSIVNQRNDIELGSHIINSFIGRTYLFKAERYNVGTHRYGQSNILQPDASNLAEVLNILQANAVRFKRFNDLVHEVLPQIKWVSVVPVQNQNDFLEIKIWTHDPKSEREDLAFSLSESGTGVGQVLAILYVVLNSDYPRTIIIDEPQSFLHRGASRKLIEILKHSKDHQFILSTHSPTIITSAQPESLLMITQNEFESHIETLDPKDIEKQQLYLREIGARTSDVFGADNILWVEGSTEEDCFPILIQNILGISLMGTLIRAVQNVSEFDSKKAKLVLDIYNNLSGSKTLLPAAIGFIFDSETRTEQEKIDLTKLSKNKAHFIKRRMFENYLLNADAISAVLNTLDRGGVKMTPKMVEQKLEELRSLVEYYEPLEIQGDWRITINGSLVLKDLFESLTEARVTYNKTRHAILLTNRIAQNSPDDFSELLELIDKILKT